MRGPTTEPTIREAADTERDRALKREHEELDPGILLLRFTRLWEEHAETHSFPMRGEKWENAFRVIAALCRKKQWEPLLFLTAQAETLASLRRRVGLYPTPGHLISKKAVDRFHFWKASNRRTTGTEDRVRRSDRMTAAGVSFAVSYLIHRETWSKAVHDALLLDRGFLPVRMSEADRLEALASALALIDPSYPSRVTIRCDWDWIDARHLAAVLQSAKNCKRKNARACRMAVIL